jgi:hypothetical protein
VSAQPKLSLADFAERYAAQGFRIFPLHHPTQHGCSCGLFECPNAGKHPRTDNGFHAASNSVALVRDWWRRWPEANIGCVPGPRHLVLDIDGPEGELTAQRMGLLSEPTLEVTSGREDGGRHRWYRHPGGTIGNGILGTGVDVRADAGYVILPPSRHRTGRKYAWVGRLDDAIALPPAILSALKSAPAERKPAALIPLEPIRAGERNNELTRYAGRMFRQGFGDAEVLAILIGLNETNCDPPMERHELELIVASIGKREAAKGSRVTPTGTVLTAGAIETAPVEVTLEDVARLQTEEAREVLSRDTSRSPRWSWPSLDRLQGPMMPGEFHVVGALMGNGKSAFLMSQMDAFARRGVGVLYIPLEIDPKLCRIRWAAWQCQLDPVAVLRGEWHHLPPDARERVEAALAEIERQPHVHFVPEKRITLASIEKWMRRAKGEVGVEVVMIDHLHRLSIGDHAAQIRVHLSETVRSIVDLTRDLELVTIAAAQLNRNNDLFDAYTPPSRDRLKESAAIGEEAWTITMLSRRFRPDVTAEEFQMAKRGIKEIAALADVGIMQVTNRKDRMAGAAIDKSVLLEVRNGVVVERERYAEAWQP